ncbi:MAG: O-antigen ligase family protein [Actinobacteria bacterium]|nr:O-antigen ligase family protein [Actinomycetota bacterium]
MIFAVGVAIAALALAEIAIFTSRFSILAPWLILLVFLWQAFTMSLTKVSLGILNVYPQDAVFIILAMVGIVRLVMRNKFTYVHILWLFLGFLIMFSFARGVAIHGFESAGVELREFFYFFAGALYFMNFPTGSQHLKRLTLAWLCVAGALFLLALFRWAAGGLSLGIPQPWLETGHGGLRVLNAAQALFLFQAFLVSLFLKFVPDSSRLWRSFSSVLLPVVVLLQHRTVWVLALVATMLAAFQQGKVRRRVAYILTSAVVAGAIFGLVVFGENISKIPDSLSASVDEAINKSDSTFIWRVESWSALLAERSSFGYSDYLFGKPFGSGYVRKVWDFERTETPHNYYIQTFLRLGVFGLIALLCTYAILISRLAQSASYKASGYFGGRLVYILLMTQLIFFITYSPSYEQGIVLGLAMALCMKRDEDGVGDQDEQARIA